MPNSAASSPSRQPPIRRSSPSTAADGGQQRQVGHGVPPEIQWTSSAGLPRRLTEPIHDATGAPSGSRPRAVSPGQRDVVDQRGQRGLVEEVGGTDGHVVAHVVEGGPDLRRSAQRPGRPRPAGRQPAGRRQRAPIAAEPGRWPVFQSTTSNPPSGESANTASIRPRTSRPPISVSNGTSTSAGHRSAHSPASNRDLSSARSGSASAGQASSAAPSRSSGSISALLAEALLQPLMEGGPALRAWRGRARHRPPDLLSQLGRIARPW